MSLLPLLLTACSEPEGAYPDECMDKIDNDGDGLVDCQDEDCVGSSDCAGNGGSSWGSGGDTSWDDMDNEEACEVFLELINSCGEMDFSEGIVCSDYGDNECELVPWFECLVEVTVCDEKRGVPEMGDWGDCEYLVKGCEDLP